MVKTYSRIVKSAAFSGLLLAASLSAYADGPVTLANGGTITWSDFVTAINSPETIKGTVSPADTTAWYNARMALQKAQEKADSLAGDLATKKTAVTTAQNAYNAANDSLTNLNTKLNQMSETQKFTTKPIGWLGIIQSDAESFEDLYDEFMDVEDDSSYEGKGEIYYKTTTGKSPSLTLSFSKPADSTGWTSSDVYDFYYDVIEPTTVKVNTLFVYLGSDYTADPDNRLKVSTYAGNKDYIVQFAVAAVVALGKESGYTEPQPTKAYSDLTKLITEQTNAKATALTAWNTAQTNATTAENDVTTANNELSAQQRAYTTAETAYNNAVATANSNALANYQNISLTGNIDVDATINKEYTGRINANQHIINVNVPAAFDVFAGRLSNAAINGVIASDYASATFSNVAAYRGTNATSAFYDDHSTRSTYTNLGALGFAARDLYGVNFTDNKLTNLGTDNANRVYDITVYELNNVSTQSYVVKSGDAFQSAKGAVTIPANRFAKSATDDLTGVNNVFYGENNTCDNALITDGETFYAPVDIQATNMTYTREFNEGYNTVCLPFELTADANIKALCEYESETPDKLYFTKIEGTIDANTPVLMVARNAFSYKDVPATIKKTTDMIIVGKGPGNSSESYGFLKKTGRGEFEGDSQGYRVLGLKGQSFIAAAEGATFPAFRMVVTGSPAAVAASKAPRAIGILDEKGVEITDLLTGVQTVAADEEELTFDIVAGQGEIIFTSFEDFGKVEIYTLDGKVAAVANVTEGTTSVNVQKGLYIVMGKKFVVK